MKKIIGFLGRAGSGKSTAARYLKEQYGAEVVSFAEPLKHMTQEIFRFNDEQLFGTQEQKEKIDPFWGVSARDMLQRVGLAAREHLGKEVWVNAAMGKIQRSSSKLFVIEDVRFHNEVDVINNCPWAEGKVIRLTCNRTTSSLDHPSESECLTVPSDRIFAEINARFTSDGSELRKKLAKCLTL